MACIIFACLKRDNSEIQNLEYLEDTSEKEILWFKTDTPCFSIMLKMFIQSDSQVLYWQVEMSDSWSDSHCPL